VYEVEYKTSNDDNVENEIRNEMEDAINLKVGNEYLQTDILENLDVVGISKDPTDVILSNVPCSVPLKENGNKCSVVAGSMTVYFDDDNANPPLAKESVTTQTAILDGFSTDDDTQDLYNGKEIHPDVVILRPRAVPLTDPNTGTIGSTSDNKVEVQYAYELEFNIDDGSSTNLETLQAHLEEAINEKITPSLMMSNVNDGSSSSVIGVSSLPKDQVLQNVPCSQKQSVENDCVLVQGTSTVYLEEGVAVSDERDVTLDAIKQGMDNDEFDNVSDGIEDVRYVSLPLTNLETGTFGFMSDKSVEIEYAYELEYKSDSTDDLSTIQFDLENAINEEAIPILMGDSDATSSVIGVSSNPADQVLQSVECSQKSDGNDCVLVTGTMTVYLDESDSDSSLGEGKEEELLTALEESMSNGELNSSNDNIIDVRYVNFPLTDENGLFGSTSDNPLQVDYAYELEYNSNRNLSTIQSDLEEAINEKTIPVLMGSSSGDSGSMNNVVGVSSSPNDQVLQNVPCTQAPIEGNYCVLMKGTMTVYLDNDGDDASSTGGSDVKEAALDAIKDGMDNDEFDTANEDIVDVRYVTLPLTDPETGVFGSTSDTSVEIEYAYEMEYDANSSSSDLFIMQENLEEAINEKVIPTLMGGGDGYESNVVGLGVSPLDQVLHNVDCAQVPQDGNNCVLVKGTMTVYLQSNTSLPDSAKEETLSVIEEGMENDEFDSVSDVINDVRYVTLPLTDENGMFGSASDNAIKVEYAYELEYNSSSGDLSDIQSDLEKAIAEDSITTLMGGSESNVVGISASPPDLILEKVPCSQQADNSTNECVVTKGEMTVYLEDEASVGDEHQVAVEGIQTGISTGEYLDSNDSFQSIRNVPLPLTDENGLFGVETDNKIEVEYAYELEYAPSGDLQTILPDLELAINEESILALMASSNSSVVGLSSNPEDEDLELPCRPETPGNACRVIQGSMTLYLDEDATPGDENVLALETIKSGMDKDAFVSANDDIHSVRSVESLPTDGLVGVTSTNLVEVDYAYEFDYMNSNSTLLSQSHRELDEAVTKYVASEMFQDTESSVVGVSPYPEDYPLYNIPCTSQSDAEYCLLVKAKLTLYLEEGANMVNETQQAQESIMAGMNSNEFDSINDNIEDVRYVQVPLTNEDGRFGSTSSNYIEVDYAYEIEYDPAGNLTNIQADLEKAINEKTIPALMGNPESNVVGLSSFPSDQVLTVPCSSEEDKGNACVVVKGTMTAYLQDDSEVTDEEQTARGEIKAGMDNDEFKSANSNIIDVRYIELPFTDKETGIFGSMTNNSIPVNYAYELEYAAEGDLDDIQPDLEFAINDKIIPLLMSEADSTVVGVSSTPQDQVLESIKCSQQEVGNNCFLVKGALTLFLQEDAEIGDEEQVASNAIKSGMDNDEFVSSNINIHDVRYVQTPLTDPGTGTFGDISDNALEVDYAYELEYLEAGNFDAIQSDLEQAISEEVIPAVMSDSSLGVVGLSTLPADQMLQGVPCSQQDDGNRCTLMKGVLTLYLRDGESTSAEKEAIDAIRSGMDNDRFDSANDNIRDVRYVELPLSDENGMFGSNSSKAVEVDYAYELEYDKDGNLSDIISDAENAINEEVIPGVMGGSEPIAVGVSASPEDQVVDTVSCSVQPVEDNGCVVVKGTVTVYLDEDSSLSDEEVGSTAREAISDAMATDKDIVSSNDDIRDIRYVSIATDKNGLKGVKSQYPIEVEYPYEVEFLSDGSIQQIRPDLEGAINDVVLPDIFVPSNIIGVGTYPEDLVNLDETCQEIQENNRCNFLTGLLTIYVKDPSLVDEARKQAIDSIRSSMEKDELDKASEKIVDVRFRDGTAPSGSNRGSSESGGGRKLGYQLGVGLGVPLGVGLVGVGLIYLKKKDDDEEEPLEEVEDLPTEVDAV